MNDRLRELGRWVSSQLQCDATIALVPASGDASFRRYFRLDHEGESLIAMDAPAPQEDLGRFLRLAHLLCGLGLHVPQIHAAAPERGFALVSDLGTQTYLDALGGSARAAAAEPAQRLYRAAIEALVSLQDRGRGLEGEVPPYNRELLCAELGIFEEWFLDRHLGIVLTGSQRQRWRALCDLLCEAALAQPRVLVHRDYHSRNLMVSAPLPGILDFQDAVWGPVSYDLVSLLRDCYIRWPAAQVDTWIGEYHALAAGAGVPVGEAPAFREWFDLTGMQRHLKAIGIFARLHHRDGRPEYLSDIPRVLGYIDEICVGHERLGWLSGLIHDSLLPALEPRT